MTEFRVCYADVERLDKDKYRISTWNMMGRVIDEWNTDYEGKESFLKTLHPDAELYEY